MTNTVISYKDGAELIDAFVARGLTPAHIKIALDSEGILSSFVRNCQPPIVFPVTPRSTTLAHAKAVFGENYHDPAKWASKCKFRRSEAIKEIFEFVPEVATDFASSKQLLIPILPLSIMQLHRKHTELFYSKEDPWFAAEAFANEQPEPGWMLFSRDVLADSTSKTYAQQEAMLQPGECLPTAAELCQALICHAVLTGERLLPSIYARSSSVDSDGSHVYLGLFDSQGLRVLDYWVGTLTVTSAWRRPGS